MTDIIGIAINKAPIKRSAAGDTNPLLFLGLDTINLNANKLTQMLPIKKILPIETVKIDGGTFGASSTIAEPTIHKSVNGNKANPKGRVIHLGNDLGSANSGSIVRLTLAVNGTK
ncbi:hypothetical protein [Pseudoalteromonas sp. MTN2-4]|uniref:hypothetical protein n=1 Tax=Pseudoalteromonas sp. MTN2-4 TaxID=3056555 RepID=UPI0036F1F2F1